MNILYCLGILILLCSGCNLKSNSSFKNTEYIRYKNEFDQNQVSHFPDTLFSDQSYIIDTDYSIHTKLFVVISLTTRSNIDTLLDRYKTQLKAEYNANDTCLLVVNEYINDENYYKANDKRVLHKSVSCDKSYLPIPNFWTLKYNLDSTKTQLPNDFKIYVLDAIYGNYWNQESKTYLNNSMPAEWSNGYSIGFAISLARSEIIYWVLIW